MTIQDQKTILKDLLAIEKKLVQLFGKTYLQALEIEAVRKAIKEGNVEFSFDNDKGAKKLFMQKLKALSEEVDSLVLNGVEKSYNDGVDSSIGSIVSGVPSGDQEQVSALCKIAINAQRKLGRDARSYANEKRGGFTISDRVWNIVGNATHEMDILVQNGIMEGKSAAEISRDVRKFLKNPKALFHMVRVKDKDGNWNGTYKLSKAAAAYHPGQGVYRSAYQNALRLARTEVNQGYRVGEWQTYQGNPLVKGFRIKLSDNHTTHDKHTGRYLPLVDICDELQGEYPKEFRWSGWHPNCRCIMVPIIMTPKEFAEYNKAKKEGEERKYVRSKEVKSLPSNFEEWLKNAKPYIESTPLQRQPYFLQDNQWVVDKRQAVLDAARRRHEARTPEQIADIKKRWEERKAHMELTNKAQEVIAMAEQFGLNSTSEYSILQKEVDNKKWGTMSAAMDDMNSKIDEVKSWSSTIDDPKAAVNQYGYESVKGVVEGINKKKKEWSNLPLEKQKSKIEFEIDYVENPGGYKSGAVQHSTWKIAQDAFKKELAIANNKIKWTELNPKIQEMKYYASQHPKSTKIANLLKEIDSIDDPFKAELKLHEAELMKQKNEEKAHKNAIKAQAKKIEKLKDQKADYEGQIKQLESDLLQADSRTKSSIKKKITVLEKKLKKVDEELNLNRFSKERKDAAMWAKTAEEADKALRSEAGKIWNNSTDAEKNSIYEYTYTFHNVNEPLRDIPYIGDKISTIQGLRNIKNMTTMIERCSSHIDAWFQRYDEGAICFKKFGLDPNNYTDADIYNLVGKEGIEPAFWSVGVAKGRGWNKGGVVQIVWNVYAPRQTKYMYVEPISANGGNKYVGKSWDGVSKQSHLGGELEAILQRGSKMRVLKVEKSSGVWYVDVEIIEQIPIPFPYTNGAPKIH